MFAISRFDGLGFRVCGGAGAGGGGGSGGGGGGHYMVSSNSITVVCVELEGFLHRSLGRLVAQSFYADTTSPSWYLSRYLLIRRTCPLLFAY